MSTAGGEGGLDVYPKTLGEWVQYINGIHPDWMELGLDRLAKVKERLRVDPTCTIVTVGGTNGKGSVCMMLESVYRRAGYRVGCYTSPHLVRDNERFRIDGQPVEDRTLCSAFAAVEEARGSVSLTYFEFCTLAAVHLFEAEAVDVALLEVGLGGRLDAVNLFDSHVAAITRVALDHMKQLGPTREHIGAEKAHIFRTGCPAVFGSEEIPDSVVDHALKVRANLRRYGAHFRIMQISGGGWVYSDSTLQLVLPDLRLPGRHQMSNAATAIAVIQAAQSRLPVAAHVMLTGLAEADLPGRCECLDTVPRTVLDVAHNPDAVRALALRVSELEVHGRTIAVIGMLGDKDARGVIAAIKDRIDMWLVTDLTGDRGRLAENLAAVIERETGKHEDILQFTSPCQAYEHALYIADPDDLVVVFGSFLTVGGVIQQFNKQGTCGLEFEEVVDG